MAIRGTISLLVAAAAMAAAVATATATAPAGGATTTSAGATLTPAAFVAKYCGGATIDESVTVSAGAATVTGQCEVRLANDRGVTLTLARGASLTATRRFRLKAASRTATDATFAMDGGATLRAEKIILGSRLRTLRVGAATIESTNRRVVLTSFGSITLGRGAVVTSPTVGQTVTANRKVVVASRGSVTIERGARVSSPLSALTVRGKSVDVQPGSTLEAGTSLWVTGLTRCTTAGAVVRGPTARRKICA